MRNKNNPGGWNALMVVLVSAVCVLGISGDGVAQQLPQGMQAVDRPPDRLQEALHSADMESLGEGKFQLGAVVIDQKQQSIYLPGRINMTQGPIELLACAPGGRTHETVLVVDVEPIHVQTGLLLIGLQPGQSVRVEGDPVVPKGSAVIVDVTWELKGVKSEYRGEDLVLDVKSKATMPRTSWVFTGSQIQDGRFMAQEEKSIITTYRFPFTILDNPLPSGTDDEVYVANTVVLPPVGTPVTVILSAANRKDEQTDEEQ